MYLKIWFDEESEKIRNLNKGLVNSDARAGDRKREITPLAPLCCSSAGPHPWGPDATLGCYWSLFCLGVDQSSYRVRIRRKLRSQPRWRIWAALDLFFGFRKRSASPVHTSACTESLKTQRFQHKRLQQPWSYPIYAPGFVVVPNYQLLLWSSLVH